MYFISIITLIIAVGIICILSFASFSGFVGMFDMVTLLLVLLLWIPMIVSGGLWKDFNNAFRFGVGRKQAKNLMELKRAKEAVSLSIKVLITSAIFVVGVEFIQVLYNMEDISTLGPTLAVMALSLVYGVGIALILLPLQSILNVKVLEYINEQD